MCFGANVVANESNNYAFSSTITLPPVTVAPMSNLTFDWSGLTKDFLGHSLNPATDLDMGVMMIWALPRADFEAALNADALYTADLVVSPPLNLPLAGETSAQLHDFLVNGTAPSRRRCSTITSTRRCTRPPTPRFIIGVQTGTDLGRGIRMLQAFDLDASSTITNVTLTNDSTKLTYTANLHNLTITGVPGGTPALTLDWSQMTDERPRRRVQGGLQSRSAIVGHYTQTPAQLEASFSISIASRSRPTAPTSLRDRRSISRRCRDESGASFPGIDDSGTWLVGLDLRQLPKSRALVHVDSETLFDVARAAAATNTFMRRVSSSEATVLMRRSCS